MDRDSFVNPGEHDPQRDCERVFVRANDVAVKARDDVAQQGIAINGFGPRLNNPMTMQGRRLAARPHLDVNLGSCHTERLGGLLALARVVEALCLSERGQQLIFLRLRLRLFFFGIFGDRWFPIDCFGD
jgi:hypothetical protein